MARKKLLKSETTRDGFTKNTFTDGSVTYTARVTIGYKRLPNGDLRQKQIQKTYKLLGDLKTWVAENEVGRQTDAGHLQKKESSREQLNVFIDQYLKNVQRTKKGNTWDTYKRNIDKWVRPYIGHMKLKDLTAHYLGGIFIDEVMYDGISEKTLVLIHKLLKYIFEYLEDNDYIVKTPMKRVKLPAFTDVKSDGIDYEKYKYHTQALADQFIEHTTNTSQGDLIFCGYSTGMRIGEMAALRFWDINFLNGTITIMSNMQKFMPTESQQKVTEQVHNEMVYAQFLSIKIA